ncbi:MAG: hypothetical protein WB622_06420 [Acidobacteriaceae bacterium]|jgi:hypothetical protein
MVSLGELPLLALGVLVSVGLGFLFWMLYHLAWEAHSTSRTRRSR